MKTKPLTDHIVITPSPGELVARKVVAARPGRVPDEGKKIPLDLEVEDTALYDENFGTEVSVVRQKAFVKDVGMSGLPFPMRVASKLDARGQPTVGTISVTARIMRDFEASWIDTFIQLLHQHREEIGTATLRVHMPEYLKELRASTVRVNFDYPFFVEKATPVTGEKSLVRYLCTYSAKISAASKPKVHFRIAVPAITTYPQSSLIVGSRPFGQLSTVTIETDSENEIYPEDLVELVDRHALAPVYSFLAPEDQDFLIQRINHDVQSSVMLVDAVKGDLSRNESVSWFSVRCDNAGMLHEYSTFIGTEKSMWIPDTEAEVSVSESV